MEKSLNCIELMLRDHCKEDMCQISTTRISELVSYLDSNPMSTPYDVCLANSLARICPPPVPVDDEGDRVRTNPEKLQELKESIRLLRERIKSWETQKLYGLHHLMRTKAVPGVYSDPFSGQVQENDSSFP